MKNQPLQSRLNHSQGSLFVLSTKSTGIIAAVSVGLATAAQPYATRMTSPTLLLAMGALQCGWLGATLAISFMEAPVKFLAPSPARRSLIDVGRHVFSALNKVEVPLATFNLLGWYIITQRGGLVPGSSSFRHLGWRQWLRFGPGLIVYLLQSFSFLPVMRSVGARYVEGRPVESAKVHGIYVGLEVLKVATLTASTVTIGRALIKATSA
ncbi:hypothetical protein BGX29_012324 [Mortierella sp. GBA35]|nr:hypothetical protein BGX23_009563 [Mortierella sp. AD031]KAF9105409.1 hypothetical protein BGX29_012324 [Mortierella sp. GBA35]KAG0213746.1 hypothetical protein BGX33_002701 [Mortierella sp. NVP41]